MRKLLSIFCLLLFVLPIVSGQSVDPVSTLQRCPTLGYPNAAGQYHKFSFTLLARNYSVKSASNVVVKNWAVVSDYEAECLLQFDDKSATPHSVTFQNNLGFPDVSFTFSKIGSIVDRVIENFSLPNSITVPLCTTIPIFVQFPKMQYRKTGSTSTFEDYGSEIEQYEYDLPDGWIITNGSTPSPLTPGLVVSSNDVVIQPDALSPATQFRVRAINQWCNSGLSKQSQWKTVTITGRPSIKLTSAGSTSLNIICGDLTSRTFTLENATSAGCITSYQWHMGSDNGWLYNNADAPDLITTTTNTLTLTPKCAQIPKNVSVSAYNGSTLLKTFAPVTVNLISPPRLYELTGPGELCQGASQTYQISNLTCDAAVTWSVYPSGFLTEQRIGNTLVLTNTSDIQIQVNLTASVTSTCGSAVKQKTITTGKANIYSAYYDYQGGNHLLYTTPPRTLNVVYNDVCNGYYTRTNLTISSNATVTWQPVSTLDPNVQWHQDGNNLVFALVYPDQTATFRVTASNSCGTVYQTYAFKSVWCYGNGGGGIPARMATNAADNEVDIIVNDKKGIITQYTPDMDIKEVRMYDLLGRLRKVQNITSNTFNISSLPPGVYLFQLITKDGGTIVRKQISIQ
jgi:hypothetical protein